MCYAYFMFTQDAAVAFIQNDGDMFCVNGFTGTTTTSFSLKIE